MSFKIYNELRTAYCTTHIVVSAHIFTAHTTSKQDNYYHCSQFILASYLSSLVQQNEVLYDISHVTTKIKELCLNAACKNICMQIQVVHFCSTIGSWHAHVISERGHYVIVYSKHYYCKCFFHGKIWNCKYLNPHLSILPIYALPAHDQSWNYTIFDLILPETLPLYSILQIPCNVLVTAYVMYMSSYTHYSQKCGQLGCISLHCLWYTL